MNKSKIQQVVDYYEKNDKKVNPCEVLHCINDDCPIRHKHNCGTDTREQRYKYFKEALEI